MSENVVLDEGDIVQLVPPHRFAGCLAYVDEPKSFGAQLVIPVPHEEGVRMVPIRTDFASFVLIQKRPADAYPLETDRDP